MSAFKVGDGVVWDSQAAGVWRVKCGEVVEVVPAGKYPVRKVDGGFTRDHESYVVRASAVGRKGPARTYWPRVSALRSLS